MRTYGRILVDENGQPVRVNTTDPRALRRYTRRWVVVETDSLGLNDYVMLTSLAQALLLNQGESPFFADWGIPAVYSVLQQIFPDFSMTLTAQRFQSQFASLVVVKVDDPVPTYRINALTHTGVRLNAEVPIPI